MPDADAGSRKLEPTAASFSSLRGIALLAALLSVAVGPVLFRTLNRVKDRPSRSFAGVVTRKYALRGKVGS